jgi:membrane-associated phospholipid phosphatase
MAQPNTREDAMAGSAVQITRLIVLAAAVGIGTCDTAVGPGELASSDVVVAWNERVLEIAEAEDGFLTLKGLRTATMMHLAMHDALAAIDPRYGMYRASTANAEPGVDAVAAANAAAYAVALSQYPDQESSFVALRARFDGAAAGSAAAGSLGEQAAAAVLESREGDSWDAAPEYQWHPMGPGVYAEFNEHSGTPEGFVFGAGWARARPFALSSPDEFRSAPPPAIDSDAYTQAYAEVNAVGASESGLRTSDQAHLAMWWKQFVEKSHNRLARELVMADDPGLWAGARMFALLNASIYDGYIASFDSKFHYNHWRPYTAIRWASNDGNPDTAEDPVWTNLHDHTYAFPSYPSAHGTVCAAAMTVLADAFGEDRPVEMTTREVDSAGPFSPPVTMDPATRSFENFAAAAEECALSRVYLGIHFRYDSDAGTVLGRKVGGRVLETLLAPRQDEGSSGAIGAG